MKKLLLVTLTLIGSLVLIACGGKKPVPGNKISLSYADWGDQVTNQKMIDAFEAKYPHISVELRTDIAGSGEEFTGNLITASQNGVLPDVFATDNVPVIVEQGLTLDVSEYWDKDEDAKLVYEYIAKTAIYGEKRYGIPSFQFLKGVMINLDIFENANLTTTAGKYRIDDDGYPMKDWTFNEMIEIAKAIKNISSDPAETVIGLDTWYGTPDFQQVWPTMEDADLMYDTWDGSKFNYTNAHWISAMQEKVRLHQLTDGTTTKFTPDQLEQYPHLDGYLIQTGIGAMDIEGSWQFWVIQEAKKDNINLGFWPYPRATNGNFYPPVILDYQAVSSQTQYPEEAYLLAKWMTYGKDGWNARLDILDETRKELIAKGETPAYLDRYPIADYPEIWAKVDGFVDGIEGIQATFEHIANGKPDLDKWMPGYRDFWAWANDAENTFGWEALVTAGATSVPTYATEWNKKINELVQQTLDKLK
ncbi:ABC transporter substrate-binding protein [Haploplasma axanthum]|uniref:Maltose-binding periplasmic proteins/domains n=1 Tax=Haploplasma axanthum TaxID=29552 RepID=A0A449BE57_HAPAX|nr:hypothetical protein [Haploplasma axanthum]VEU80715.1 Maltose-binding periplasmic proteins/domains [Haploplasma axanthum]